MANERHLAVVGGGISGLAAAYYAAKDGYKVDIYEATDRMGGKIKSEKLDGSSVERGGEFIDSTDKDLIQLCDELGVQRIPNFENTTEVFRLPNGQTVDADTFYAVVKPIQEKITKDKAIVEADPFGARAQYLDSISIDRYMDELTLRAPDSGQKSIFGRIGNFFRRITRSLQKEGKIDSSFVTAVKSCYQSEIGVDLGNASALLYVRESFSRPDNIIAGDCKVKIAGGTERIINALEARLKEMGVAFHPQEKLMGIKKEFDDSFSLAFESANGTHVDSAEQVVLALPAHKLGAIQGLETMGLSKNDIALLSDTQSNYSSQFSVKIRNGVTLPDIFMFSHDGWTAWIGTEGTVTFYAGGKTINQQSEQALVENCLRGYAESVGMPPEQIFDLSKGMVFNPPNPQNPCYPSPAPGQAIQLSALTQKVQVMAEEKGLGIAGNFLLRPDGGIGFMQCGVASADIAIQALKGEMLARNSMGQGQQISHTARVDQSRAAAATRQI